MALKIMSGAAYQDVMKSETNIPNISLKDEIPDLVKSEDASLSNSDNPTNSNRDGQKDKAASLNLLKSAIDNANNKLMFKRTRCEFTYYDDINRVAIKVIDRDTDDVIREIPPEETLELVQKLWEFAGLIVDEKR